MSQQRKKPATPKGSNGQGESVTVYFDASDLQERRAMLAAQMLAVKHGRRKQAVIALLETVYRYYEQTGELLSPIAIASALERGLNSASTGYTLAAQPAMDELYNRLPAGSQQTIARQMMASNPTRAAIHVVENTRKVSGADVASSFASSLAGFLG